MKKSCLIALLAALLALLFCGFASAETMVAEVDGTQYATVQSAVDACGEKACTVKLIADSTASFSLAWGQAITLDLNGHTITCATTVATVKGAELIIEDSSAAQNGALICSGNNTYTVVATTGAWDEYSSPDGSRLIIKGGTISYKGNLDINTWDSTNYPTAVKVESTQTFSGETAQSTLTLDGGTISAVNGDCVSIFECGGSSIVINDGASVKSDLYDAIRLTGSLPSLTMYGGSVSAANGYGIYQDDNVSCDALTCIAGGTISGKVAIEARGTVTICGGTLDAATRAINMSANSTLTISGTACVSSSGPDAIAINNAKLVVLGGKIKGKTTYDNSDSTLTGGYYTYQYNDTELTNYIPTGFKAVQLSGQAPYITEIVPDGDSGLIYSIDKAARYKTFAAAIEDGACNLIMLGNITENLSFADSSSALSITIDLNGHVLRAADSSSESCVTCIHLGTNINLTIKDSNPSAEHHFADSTNKAGLWVWDATETATDHIVKGGVITGNYTDVNPKQSSAFYIHPQSSITMEGGTVAGHYNNGGVDASTVFLHGGASVKAAATLTMNNKSSIIGNYHADTLGVINLNNTAYLCMNDYSCIAMNYSEGDGGGVNVCGAASRLKMYDYSSITGNKSATLGGGVSVSYGNVYMYDHSSVSKNSSNGNGGGVAVGTNTNYSGNLSLSNCSSISDNEAAKEGGGVYLQKLYTFTMEHNAAVTGNKAGTRGGGLSFNHNSYETFLYDCASICNNTAGTVGGGIYTNENLAIYNTCSITGNTAGKLGGGIYKDEEAILTLYKNPIITGNTLSDGKTASNILLVPVSADTTVDIYGENVNIKKGEAIPINLMEFSSNDKIGVAVQETYGSSDTATVFPQSVTLEKTVDYSSLISSDNSKYEVFTDTRDDDGTTYYTVKLGISHIHSWTYTAAGNSITATCANTDGKHKGSTSETLTISAPPYTYYGADKDDSSKTPAAVLSGNTIGGYSSLPAIQYQKQKADSSWDAATTTPPTTAGSYKASITIGEGINALTASVTYSIGTRLAEVSETAPIVYTKNYDGTANLGTKTGGLSVTYLTGDSEPVEYTFPTAYPDKAVKSDYSLGITIAVKDEYKDKYHLDGQTQSLTWPATGVINPAPITVSGIKAVDRDYVPGSLIVELDYTSVQLGGKVAGEDVSVTAVGTMDNADAGENKAVTISDLSLSGNNAGNYTLAASGQQATATVNIGKVASVLTKAPTAISGLTYTPAAQTLVTAGEAQNGTVMYAFAADDVTKPSAGWSASLPQGTDVGTYYVWYYVKGDANHIDTEAGNLSASIGYAASKVLTPPSAVSGLIYKTAPQDLITAGVAENGTMNYSLGTETDPGQNWSIALPQGTDPGVYYVWYKSVGNANYSDTEPERVDAVIGVAPSQVTSPPTGISNLVYTGTALTLHTVGAAQNGIMNYALGTDSTTRPTEWSETPVSATKAGIYYVWYKSKGNTNYSDTEPLCITINIDKAPLTIENAVVEEKAYDGTTAANVTGVTLSGMVSGETLTMGSDYTVSGEFNSADPGTGDTVTVTVTLLNTAAANNYRMNGSKAVPGMVTLILEADPEIATVNEGQKAEFVVRAKGGNISFQRYFNREENSASGEQKKLLFANSNRDDLSLQWYVNRHDGNGWVKIDGAVYANYSTAETTLDNDGYEYCCKVGFPSGSIVESSTATLRVVKDPPKTGENSNVLLWSVLGVASISCLLFMLFRKKRISK